MLFQHVYPPEWNFILNILFMKMLERWHDSCHRKCYTTLCVNCHLAAQMWIIWYVFIYYLFYNRIVRIDFFILLFLCIKLCFLLPSLFFYTMKFYSWCCMKFWNICKPNKPFWIKIWRNVHFSSSGLMIIVQLCHHIAANA